MAFKDLKSEVCKFSIRWNLKFSVHHTGAGTQPSASYATAHPWQVVWGPATLLCSHNRLWPSKYKILTIRPFIENAWRTLPYENIRKSFYVFWVEPQTSRSPNSNLTLELVTDSQVASEGILSLLPAIAPCSLDAFFITLVSVIEVQKWGERSLVNGQRLAGALGTELESEVLQGLSLPLLSLFTIPLCKKVFGVMAGWSWFATLGLVVNRRFHKESSGKAMPGWLCSQGKLFLPYPPDCLVILVPCMEFRQGRRSLEGNIFWALTVC